MEFGETLRRRRMVRSFSGRAVPGPVLERILDGALRAPSAGNTGGWDLVVLEGPSETALFWQATTTADWRSHSRRWPGLEKAPVALVLYAHPDAYLERYRAPDKQGSGLGGRGRTVMGPGPGPGTEPGPEDGWPVPYWYVDGGFAALSLLLGATDAGLGGCLMGNFRGEEALAGLLGVPEGRRYLGTVLIGEPGGDDPASSSLARGRRKAGEVVHRSRW
ncbi:MAG TPA: nitroreductase family protein [Acidimicrobiales bacterium]|nr:nitroreductase family protein [Acidimicrobiales bacterium]